MALCSCFFTRPCPSGTQPATATAHCVHFKARCAFFLRKNAFVKTRFSLHTRALPLYDEIFQSIKGVGPALSLPLSLLADLPELGTLNRKQIAALAGIAPLNRDSGQMKGKRIVWSGRAQLRAVLYMSTLVATKHNPIIRALYQRLLQAGKCKKVAITACMRKLLTIMNVMVKNKTKWQSPVLKAA